jgi:predicted small secreted protein
MRYLLIAGCVALVGCNTMNGPGEDTQRSGSSLSNKATGGERPLPAPEPAPYYPPAAPPQH